MSEEHRINSSTKTASFHQVLTSHELGGAGLTALRIAQFLRNGSHDSHVWTPGSGPAGKKANDWGLITHHYDSAGAFNARKLVAAAANCSIAYAMRRMGPGVVHIHSPAHYGALRLGVKLSGLKRVVHVQLEEVSNGGICWAFKHPPDLIITCARFLMDPVRHSLPEPYQSHQRIVAVPNAVDTELFYPSRKSEAKSRVDAPMNAPLILVLANLSPHKGQETAIRATALLKSRGTVAACWLAGVERNGTNNYRKQLQQLVNELGLDKQVRFLGFRHDVADLLRAADLLLLPSTREGLPLSILEAQATKVPVIAAPTAGIPELVTHNETGFLVAADDYAGYAAYVELLTRNQDLYHFIADKAYSRVIQAYTWLSCSERIWELYCELLDRAPDRDSFGVC